MLPDAFLEREVEAICAQYRITPEDARALCENCMQRRPDLLRTILPQVSRQDITRLKAYKILMKEVRKQVYYHLRQYQPGKDSVERLRQQLAASIATRATASMNSAIVRQLLHTHVSTRERLDYYQEFYDTLFALIDPPQSILDVGCGMHPLSYPYAGGVDLGFISHDAAVHLDVYVAIDKQAEVIDTLQIFAPAVVPTRLIAVCKDIGEMRDGGAGSELLASDTFDLALMLKLIPVVARQQRHLLPMLAGLPVRRMLITAATEAMTRKQNIRRREERVLRDFIELTGRRVQAAFQVGSEFGFLLDTPEAGARQKFS